jgi:hypothetical protein
VPRWRVSGVVQRVLRRVLARVRDGVDPVRAECVPRQDRGHGRVDAARQAEQDRREAVLLHVVVQAQAQGLPDLLEPVELGRERGLQAGLDRGGLLREDVRRRAHQRGRVVGEVAARGGGAFDVGDQQLGGEAVGAGQKAAVRGPDHRPAVEDQVVLAADGVEIGHRSADLGGPLLHDGDAPLVFALLVGGGVDVDDETGPGFGRDLEGRSAPYVLTHGERDVDAPDAREVQFVARDEPAVLVEHSVVRKVMLVVAEQDLAVLDQRQGVADAVTSGGAHRSVGVEVADSDGQVPVAVRGEFGGERDEALAAGFHERVAQGEVLDGIAREGLLAGGEQVGPGCGGGSGGGPDESGIVVEVAYNRVVLGECDTERRHAPIVPRPEARRHRSSAKWRRARIRGRGRAGPRRAPGRRRRSRSAGAARGSAGRPARRCSRR